MNCFQLIKSVLDEAYSQIPGDEVNKDNDIKEAIQYLREEYRNLLTRNNITYSDPITRFAYIYIYVTSHANLVCTLIEKDDNLGKLFNNSKVNVACIGGGPGSDFLGILKYLMTNQKSPTVKFQLCDKEKTWADSWYDVDEKVDPIFRISTSYLPLDITKPDDWQAHNKYFQSDLFTMIYFMSEVYTLQSLANEYFANLFSQAKPGSLFLFVDNNNPKFYDWFDKLSKDNSISTISKKTGTISLPPHEEKNDLEIYFEKFQTIGKPKISSDVAYRVGRKE
ncbi:MULTISPECIES: hypothetical protein [unclassified Nostoc]|uniref:hypothetical protein n=1 Tax=unclassified Nostoc TaxID=2593658 RepID=UPI002AD1E6D9|nr:hypothetical protein [Nostoc sp. DedQUE03]MDZ7975008.1 hypothetical protein [Nostoc sp. DedQUE03]MDZ8046643.1 hypothetical protein [Nostoc sp. DedQUE02]MDZ8072961.1 hypothetical protein [Nostoc sp. DedQUE01]